MVWFFLFFIWIWLLIVVFTDIFRSDDLGGWGKALWTIFVIVVPDLGVFIYLIARGRKMSEHAASAARQQDEATREYIRSAAGTTPVVPPRRSRAWPTFMIKASSATLNSSKPEPKPCPEARTPKR